MRSWAEAHVAVSAARAHLRPIGRQPAHFQAFAHAHLGEQLPQQQHALAAEARDFNGQLLNDAGPACFLRPVRIAGGLQHFLRRMLRRRVVGR